MHRQCLRKAQCVGDIKVNSGSELGFLIPLSDLLWE